MKRLFIIYLVLIPILTEAQISGILDVKFLSTIKQVKDAMIKKGAKIDLKNTNVSKGVYTYSGLKVGDFTSTTTVFHFLDGQLVLASVLFSRDSDPEGVDIYNSLIYGLSRQYGAGNDLTKISFPYKKEDKEKITAIRSGYVRLRHEWDDGDKFIGRIELSLNQDLFPILKYQHRPTIVGAQMAEERIRKF